MPLSSHNSLVSLIGILLPIYKQNVVISINIESITTPFIYLIFLLHYIVGLSFYNPPTTI